MGQKHCSYFNRNFVLSVFVLTTFVDYFFQLHRPYQDFVTASYCHYNYFCHYGIIISVDFSYRSADDLFRTVQFLYDHDWKSIKSGSEFTLEDSMVYSYQDNSKRPKTNPSRGQKMGHLL